MKQYTHAWLALMAIKRLDQEIIPDNLKESCNSLVSWFKTYRDDVVKGAWYPDAVIKDMATSHVLKFKPKPDGDKRFKKLPGNYYFSKRWDNFSADAHAYEIVSGNLPDRCEALAHSLIDNLKMQHKEHKGSPIAPTSNHIANLFFMLSHYVADAHVPLHCDVRPFSDGKHLHADIEKYWDNKVRKCYEIDFKNKRFYYDRNGFPLQKANANDEVMSLIEDEIKTRKFIFGWGDDNNNTWDFMSAICQHSYLTAYKIIPANRDNTLDWDEFLNLNVNPDFDVYSKELLSDAIESIAKVWIHVWRRYLNWRK
nr:hypothetical protein [uncultured Draconibacterium sp.]